MLKIVVCDSGWGGELVADFLSEELGMVEVVRVIDWPHASYHDRSSTEISQLAEAALNQYLNQVDLIVLGGYATSLALDNLQAKYPNQSFVSMGYSLQHILHTKNYPYRIGILAGRQTINSDLVEQLHEDLPQSTFASFDCGAWESPIDDGELSTKQIRADLDSSFKLATKTTPRSLQRSQIRKQKQRNLSLVEQLKLKRSIDIHGQNPSGDIRIQNLSVNPSTNALHGSTNIPKNLSANISTCPTEVDAVLLLDTHLWEIKSDLEEAFGWRVRTLDFRRKLLHDVCFALGLRGVDGGRGRH